MKALGVWAPLCCLAFAALSLSMYPAHAAPWADDLARATQSLDQATSDSQKKRVLTQMIAAQERGLADLGARLRGLERDTDTAQVALRAQEDRTAATLAVLQRLSRSQGPLPLLHPGGPTDAARAGMLAVDLGEALAADQQDLANRLKAFSELEQAARMAADALSDLRRDTDMARQALIDAADPPAEFPIPDAGSLTDLLDGVPAAPVPAGQGTGPWPLPLPARVQTLGDGWLLIPNDAQLVRVPTDAVIHYAGPLRRHRMVVIAGLDAGTVLILAGLDTVLVATGQDVPAGSALGFAPTLSVTSTNLHTNVTPTAFPAGDLPADALYMEVRVAGRPVDPGQWFALQEDDRR